MFQRIRTYWKTSIFLSVSLGYGSKWSYDRYKANEIRRFYCQQANLIGSQSVGPMIPLRRVAVLLNGKAQNGNAKSIYDKTIFPLLNLIGLDVRVHRIDALKDESALKELITDKMEPNELSALLIVGGDGTLSKISPYLSESTVFEKLPICLVPIGDNVSFAQRFFPSTEKKKFVDDVALLSESIFSLFDGNLVRRPLLKVRFRDEQQETTK